MKQTYTYEVNGFQIHAEYEEKDIETIFIPLLKKWKEMQKKAGTGGEAVKDLFQYGNRREEEWEILPWIPDSRPPFKIWVKPEQIAPFFLIPHHPYAISLLLKISDGFRTEEFRRLGLIGSSEDWERLVRGVIQEFEENNSGVDLFHFDSDEDVFCVYSQYIDDLMLLSKMIRAACDNEKTMGMYLNMSEVAKA